MVWWLVDKIPSDAWKYSQHLVDWEKLAYVHGASEEGCILNSKWQNPNSNWGMKMWMQRRKLLCNGMLPKAQNGEPFKYKK